MSGRVNVDDFNPDWLRSMLPTGAALAAGPIGEPGPSAFPDEEAAIAHAVARRRFEFRAGRAYARQALSEVGGPAAAIGRGPAGDPIWPSGFTGSITHADDLACAVVARASAVTALGVDIENGGPLDGALSGVICRPDELAAAAAQGSRGADPVKRLLVAKEAFIKLSYSMTGVLPELLDIRVAFQRPSEIGQAFRATRGAGSAGYEGRLAWSCGRVAAVMYVRRTGDS